MPIWLWPNLLGLDAPIVAVLWQRLLAQRFSLPLHPAGQLVLGLTVWAIYLTDRLLDARQAPIEKEPARHGFCREHRKWMTTLLAMVLGVDVLIACFGLRRAILRDGLVPLAGVLIYLCIVHAWTQAPKIPKEIATAVLFTIGTFLTAWAALPCPRLAWAGFAFFVLCLANLIAIEAWEPGELRGATRWLANTYLVWVPAAAVICVAASRDAWYICIAASACACALLFWLAPRLSLNARRALVDGALLSPALLLMLK